MHNIGEESLDEAIAAVRNGTSDSLSLFDYNLQTGQDTEKLVRAIQALPELRGLSIPNGTLNAQGVHDITEAIAGRTDLERVNVNFLPLGDGQQVRLMQALGKQKDLRRVHFSGNLTDAGVTALAGVLQKSENIEHVVLDNCEWEQPTHRALAQALSDKRKLLTVDLGGKPGTLDDRVWEQGMMMEPHPNLLVFRGVSSNAVVGMTQRNRKQRDHLDEMIADLGRSLCEPPQIPQEMTFEKIAGVEAQRPALLHAVGHGSRKLADYDYFLDHLPKLKDGKGSLLDALLTETAAKFAPIENPQVWKDPELLRRLYSERSLEQGDLTRETSSGVSVLEAVAGFQPVRKVIDLINASDARIGYDDLFTATRQPKRLLSVLDAKKEVPALFTTANWDGHEGELRRVLRDLPEAMLPKRLVQGIAADMGRMAG